MRIVKLVRHFRDFNQIFEGMRNTVKDITNISIIMLLFLFVYALLGMNIYAFRVTDDEDLPVQSNFDSLFNAMATVFIVLANDGWAKIYFQHYRATDGVSSSFFFLSLILIGQFILMNLFVGILIENFEEISVRQDFINKIQEINQITMWQKIKEVICLRTERKNKDEDKLDEILNEEIKRKHIEEDKAM